ncbi:hypothetical protein [Flavobacterium sp. ASW18X]|uniref:hypothetical protein n=1 Tax=Flavobacterium sp. ASW18X TaxID=2572595 RepID=UPI00146A2A5E|nr:hypothetical protein [Flavobacterium sp. ASW18X]
MSIGNPKKFEALKKLEKITKNAEIVEESGDSAKLYIDKNHLTKKELTFKTDADKPKWA